VAVAQRVRDVVQHGLVAKPFEHILDNDGHRCLLPFLGSLVETAACKDSRVSYREKALSSTWLCNHCVYLAHINDPCFLPFPFTIMFRGLLVAISVWGFSLFAAAQGPVPRDFCMEVHAGPHPSDTGMVFTWPPRDSVVNILVQRKPRGTGNWVPLDTLGPAELTWTDSTVLPGQAFEYWFRLNQEPNANGNNALKRSFLYAGHQRHPWPVQRRVLLLLDSTYLAPLATEIDRLEADLRAEGWRTSRLAVGRLQSPSQVRNQIIDLYNSTGDLAGVFIVGHVPVPYSGNYGPDAHFDHQGAWPADAYYGEMNGTNWTDATVNTTVASRPENHNLPGDGKFDQSSLNDALTATELWVGRADFLNLPAFTATDTALLQNYLNKDHAFRVGQNQLPRRAVVEDNFGFFGGEAFSFGGLNNWIAALGRDSVHNLDYSTLLSQPYLCSYGTGGGTYTSAGGIVSTAEFASSTFQTVFTFLFGSYFGDWDSENNLMRAAIASGPYTLTCGWSGRPHWYMHPLALGECFGQAFLTSQNNSGSAFSGGYTPTNIGSRGLHQALMGDPTLRMFYLQPPSNLVALADTDTVILNWTATPDPTAQGYHLYRAQLPDSQYVRITDQPVMATAYIDTTMDTTATYAYRVYAARLETTASGTWWNLSQGIWDSVTVPVREQVTDTTDTTNATLDLVATQLRVYPNPATERVTVAYRFPSSTTECTLVLRSLTGSAVLRSPLPGQENETSVDVSGLAPGLYLLELWHGSTRTDVVKLVIE
jgi:hypothetical protein